MVVNGFVGITISSIEKRFDLASTESGFIMSAYDIASVLCLIPVSYIGGMGKLILDKLISDPTLLPDKASWHSETRNCEHVQC